MCKLEIVDKNAHNLAILYSIVVPRVGEEIYLSKRENPVIVEEISYHQEGDKLSVLIWTKEIASALAD